MKIEFEDLEGLVLSIGKIERPVEGEEGFWMASASAVVSLARERAGDLQSPLKFGTHLQIDVSWSVEDMWVGGFLEFNDGSLAEFAPSQLLFFEATCEGRRFADVLRGYFEERLNKEAESLPLSSGRFLCEYEPEMIPRGISCERFELECSEVFRALAPEASIRFRHSSGFGIRRQGDLEASFYVEYLLYCGFCHLANCLEPWNWLPRTHDEVDRTLFFEILGEAADGVT